MGRREVIKAIRRAQARREGRPSGAVSRADCLRVGSRAAAQLIASGGAHLSGPGEYALRVTAPPRVANAGLQSLSARFASSLFEFRAGEFRSVAFAPARWRSTLPEVPAMDAWLLEAWERMTFGGVGGRQ